MSNKTLTPAEVTELSNRVARGDRQALSALFGAFGGLVLATALRLLRSRPDAEEVVQETFLEVWRRARHYQPERAAFATWVMTIARTRAIDRLRSTASRTRTTDILARESTEAHWPALDAIGDKERLKRCLDALTPEQRTALELAYFEGLSQSEIATRTGTPLGTVKTRMRLALRRMADMMVESPRPSGPLASTTVCG